MKLRPTGRDERLASAKICGYGAARLADAETLVEIRGVLAEHQVTGDRVVIVLADAASAFVDNPLRTRGLSVLIAAGADVELGRRMCAETGPGLRFADLPPVTNEGGSR